MPAPAVSNHWSCKRWVTVSIAACAAALLLACAHEPEEQSPEPFVKDVRLDVEATVEAVDPVTRTVSMRGPNGPASVVAGPEVRNFDQIRVGDKVQVTYYAGVAAQMTKKRSAEGEPVAETQTYTAPVGARPGAGVSNTVTTTVKIQSVDTSNNTVTFVSQDGFVKTLAVQSPEGEKFIRTLRPGDEVEVIYTEAVAIAVVPGA
jgi:hypothetical protein